MLSNCRLVSQARLWRAAVLQKRLVAFEGAKRTVMFCRLCQAPWMGTSFLQSAEPLRLHHKLVYRKGGRNVITCKVC